MYQSCRCNVVVLLQGEEDGSEGEGESDMEDALDRALEEVRSYTVHA